MVDRRDRGRQVQREVPKPERAEATPDRQAEPVVENLDLTARALVRGHGRGGAPAVAPRMAPRRILALQRIAGNRALAAVLHRAPAAPPAQAPAMGEHTNPAEAGAVVEGREAEGQEVAEAPVPVLRRPATSDVAGRRRPRPAAGTAPAGRRPTARRSRPAAPRVPAAPVGAHTSLPSLAPASPATAKRRAPATARGPPASRRAPPRHRPRSRSSRLARRPKHDPAAQAAAVAANLPAVRPRPRKPAPARPRPAMPAPVEVPAHTAPSPGSAWLASLVAKTAAAGQAAIRRTAGNLAGRVAAAEAGALARAQSAAASQHRSIGAAAASAKARAVAASAAAMAQVGAAESAARGQITSWHAGATGKARQAVTTSADEVRSAGTKAAADAVKEVTTAAKALRDLSASYASRARSLAAGGGGADREIADARREAGAKTVSEGLERLTQPLLNAADQVQATAAEVRRGFDDQTRTATEQVRGSLPGTLAQLDQHRDQGLAGVASAAARARREVLGIQAAALAGIVQQERQARRAVDAGLRAGRAAISAGARAVTRAIAEGTQQALRALATVADQVGAAVARHTFTLPAAQRQAPVLLAPLRAAAARTTQQMHAAISPSIAAITAGGGKVAADIGAGGARGAAALRGTGASAGAALLAAGGRGAAGIRQIAPSVTNAGNALLARAQAALSQSVSQIAQGFTDGVAQVRTQLQTTVARGETEAATTFGELRGAVTRAMAEAEARVRADRDRSWLEKAADAVGSFLKKWGPMILAVVAGVLVAVILTPFVGPLGPVIGGMIVGAVAGGVASAVGYLADVAINDKPFSWKELGKNVLIGVVTGAIGGAIGGYVAGALKNAALPLLAKVGIQVGTDVGSAVALQVGANVVDGDPNTKWDDGLLQAGLLALGVSVVSQGYSYRKGDLYGGSRPTGEVSPHPPADAHTPAEVVNTPPTALADPPNLAAAGPEPAGPRPAGQDPAGPRPAGQDPAGPVPAGQEPAGPVPAGHEPPGLLPPGQDAGPVPVGQEPAGPRPAGQDPAGPVPAGQEPAGLLPPGREPAGLLPAPDSGPVRPNPDGTPRPAGWEQVERGAFFVDETLAKLLQSGKANLGRPGDLGWVMPATDAAAVRTPADAARYTGMAPMAERAYVSGQPVFEVNFPLDGVSVRAPTAADAGGFPHWMEGGNTAVALEGGGGMLMNPTREAVFNGGVAPPAGTQITRIDPDGGRTIVHVF